MNENRLSLRAALEQDRLEDFVQQAQAKGVSLDKGSDFERGLALLMVRQRLEQEEESPPRSRG